MPDYQQTISINATPAQVFAILADIPRTSEWVGRCTGIDVLSEGAPAVGTKLRYHYKDGNRTGTMDGEVVAWEQDRRVSNHFTDKMMDVTVNFVAEPAAGGSTVTHTINIQPKGFGKLFTPMIKRSLPKQTNDSMMALKALAEG